MSLEVPINHSDIPPAHRLFEGTKLSFRVKNVLRHRGLYELKAVAVFNEREFSQVHGVGVTTFYKVHAALTRTGLSLREEGASRAVRARELFGTPEEMPVGLVSALVCDIWQMELLDIHTVADLAATSLESLRDRSGSGARLTWLQVDALKRGLQALKVDYLD